MAFLLKIMGASFVFLLQIIIARQFGPSGAGTFFLALSITTFAASMVRLGMDNPVTRFVAIHSLENEYGKVLGVVRLAVRVTFSASLVVAIIIYSSAESISNHLFEKPELSLPLKCLIVIIMPLAISVIYAKALQGLKKTSETVVILGFLTPLIACFSLYALKPEMGILGVVIIYGAAVIATMTFASVRWFQVSINWNHERVTYPRKSFFSASWPLFGAVFIEQLIQIFPLLVLGVWASISDVGLFAMAQRTSGMVGLLLVAANVVLAPKMAELFKMRDMQALAKITRYGGLIVTGAASPIIFAFLVFPKQVMSVFGGDFAEAWILLAIMSLGQLVNLVTGSVAFLLMMTGHERTHFYLNLIAAALSVFLSLLFIPYLGAIGAAISSSVPLIIVNLLRAHVVKKKLGFSVLSKSNSVNGN